MINSDIEIEYRGNIIRKRYYDTMVKIEGYIKDTNLDEFIDIINNLCYSYLLLPCDNFQKECASRDELLKKFNIKEPDDDFIKSIIKETFEFNDLATENLNKSHIYNNIEEILSILKHNDVIEDYNIGIDVQDKLIIVDIKVISKKVFGIFKKDVNIDSIKKILLKNLKNMYPNLNIVISIAVD
ncbi:DUF2226 domain-containing protein [Methanocaldococcus indicus]|uniref:DUF2226 domain-containing protein n=1 Tax=Methanocaldococcus indicus TaxID=213231 RepID=UPI003C6D7A3D